MAQRNENKRAGKEYKPRPNARGPKPYLEGPRPHVWKSGPDPLAHRQYETWLVHKAQARFRGEAHELPFEDYKELWDRDGNWSLRGRARDCICMVRIDTNLAWSKLNVEMITRKEYLARQSVFKKGHTYSKRSK